MEKVYCAPGNGGISLVADCVPIGVMDFQGLAEFARSKKIGLSVVGPENPLCGGIVDYFRQRQLRIFGPNQKAASIEGSKVFCRDLCRRHHIPSPQAWSFKDHTKAFAFLESHRAEKLVVKASGLAAGKGVVICESLEEAKKAVVDCLEGNRFGEAGSEIVIEEFLEGQEISILAVTDGRTIIPLESAKDHKPRFEDDQGPNTGGMGAISPAPAANPRTVKQVEAQILVQGIHAMVQEGRPFAGVLYAGLMITSLGPRLLEFNCRFGDPEAQPLLFRMEGDLLPILDSVARGDMGALRSGPEWNPMPAACVVAVSDGYPGSYEKGRRIHGLAELCNEEDLIVFHSGTERRIDGAFYTTGGRVLSVTARGKTMHEALDRCYAALDRIHFEGMRFRTDLGKQ